ncbi:MAG: excinuclease ABC subunit UvrC [Nannocystis sp.]|nr:excinuclease ABC subunit UvrC [Nannocystis sp.]
MIADRRGEGPPPPPPGWTPRARSAEELCALVELLPESPGVYLMRDRRGVVVYVGKANKLRARVRQYFSGHDTRSFVPLLGRLLGDIETVVTSNDKEALLLENTLIKAHRPRFNVKLRDDKQFLVLRLDPRAQWPRLELVRRSGSDGARYFGPYTSAVSVRHTLRVVNRHFKLRTCTDYTLHHRSRPCLQHQIGRCPAPCVYEVDAAAYERQVREVGLFLDGRHHELLREVRAAMEDAAARLDFEQAARLRDRLQALETSLVGQRVVGGGDADQDVIGTYREGGQVEFVVLHVRRGALVGTRSYSQRGMELPDAEVLHSFLAAYYADAPWIPDEVILPAPLCEDDMGPLVAWLREMSGRKTALLVPERGDRHKLALLARRNAAANFVARRDRRQDSALALAQLQSRLALSRLPRVIECFDISHIQGSDPVASMVVFVDGAPAKRRYRSFKIQGLGGELAQGSVQNDDFASMAEVLGRRLARGLAARGEVSELVGDALEEAAAADLHKDVSKDMVDDAAEVVIDDDDDDDEVEDALEEEEEEEEGDPWALPDLIVIDGGKGQLSRVVAMMKQLGVSIGAEGVDVVALAKERLIKEARAGGGRGRAGAAAEGAGEGAELRPERVFSPGLREPIVLRPGSSELFLITRLRDEAHRFAITHHRKRRGKRALKSELDAIVGVGPALRKALLKRFGGVAGVRAATPEELLTVQGVGARLAARIREALGSG